MAITSAKRGERVKFTPSKHTKQEKFKKVSPQDDYFAEVTQENADSVDLTVFDNGQMVFVKNIKHSSVAGKDKSKYDLIEPAKK